MLNQYKSLRKIRTEREINMAIKIVRLGMDRLENEGIRIGTVRRPPRGVKKEVYAKENWFDVWLPALSPSSDLMKQTKSAETKEEWNKFKEAFLKELKEPEIIRVVQLLAAFSHQTEFSIGCYCGDESHCHRSILKEVLSDNGAYIE